MTTAATPGQRYDARAEADRLFDDVLLVAADEIGRRDAAAALRRAHDAGAAEQARSDVGSFNAERVELQRLVTVAQAKLEPLRAFARLVAEKYHADEDRCICSGQQRLDHLGEQAEEALEALT